MGNGSTTLEATMRLEISQLQTALAKSSAEVAKFKANLKKEGAGLGDSLFGGIQRQFGDLLPALGVAAAVGGFKAITNSMDDLADTALRLNESTEMIQRVTHASEILAGVNAEGLTKSFLKLEKSLGDLENEAATKALNDLGISAEKLAAAPLDEKILMMSDAFQKARATGTGYNDILDLLGKSAGELIPMFMQTRETIQGMFDDAHIVPDEEVQRLAALNDQIDGFVAKLKGWGTEITAGVVNWIQDFGEAWDYMRIMTTDFFSVLLDTGSLDKAHAHIQGILELRQEAIDQENAAKAAAGDAAKPQLGKRGATSEAKDTDTKAKAESAKLAKDEADQAERIGKKAMDNAKLQQAIAEDKMSIDGKIAAIQERMAKAKENEAKAAAYQDTEGQLDAENQRLELQRELNRLTAEKTHADQESAEACQKMADDEEKQAQEAAKVTAERQKQVKANQAARESVMMDMAVLRLRARGQDKKADKIERNNRIKEYAADFRQKGFSKEFAEQQARERADLEDALERRRNGLPAHIYRRRGYDKKMGSDGGGGLSEFALLQKKSRHGKSSVESHDYFNDLSSRGSSDRKIPVRAMSEGSGSLADRAVRAVGAQDASETQDTSGKEIGAKILGLLEKLAGS